MVFLVITFGPLIRERLALRGRSSSQLSKNVFYDVISNGHGSVAESSAWPSSHNSFTKETELLEKYLNNLCKGIWKDISAENSLAGKIRAAISK